MIIAANMNSSNDMSEKLRAFLLEEWPVIAKGVWKVIMILLMLWIGGKIIRLVQKFVKTTLANSKIESGIATFISSLVKYGLYIVLFFIILSQFGITSASVVALLGSTGLTVGLALQGSLSNFAGGILIILLRPFMVGDYIIDHSSGHDGVVTAITVYYTTLTTFDNKYIVIPNGDLSNASITNVSRMKKRRVDLTVGVAYDTDLKAAREILTDLVASKDYVLKEENNLVGVDNLGDSSITIAVKFWVNSGDFLRAKWDMTESIKQTLDEHKISIPFNQMDVHLISE